MSNSKTKFTPGPWTFSLENRDVIRTEVGCNSILVAQLYKDSRTEANAALISAAPELFQKLIEFIDVLENCKIDAHKTDVDLNATLAEARQALAKARGES